MPVCRQVDARSRVNAPVRAPHGLFLAPVCGYDLRKNRRPANWAWANAAPVGLLQAPAFGTRAVWFEHTASQFRDFR